MFSFFSKAVEWLNPAVYGIGLAVALWAFMRCRNCGYLVLAIYFGIVLFSVLAMPSINRTIRAHRTPDISQETQEKIDAAIQQAIDRVLKEEGQPVAPAKKSIHFPFGPIVLVVGLWLVARRESGAEGSNKALHATAAAPGN